MGQQVPRAVRHAADNRERQPALGGDGAGDMAFHVHRQRTVPFAERELLGDGVDHPPVGEEAADPRIRQPCRQRVAPRGVAADLDRARQAIADHPVADREAVGQRARHAEAQDAGRPRRGLLQPGAQPDRIAAAGNDDDAALADRRGFAVEAGGDEDVAHMPYPTWRALERLRRR
jgi:hypothetical protein